jgi:CelD/BcsL family acetyltransferase involved in cellulose biosynthesis
MRFDCVLASQLTEGDWRTWDAIRGQAPGLSSPYFASEFCRAVAGCSPDLFVARIYGRHGVVGFFPFHRSRWHTGWPLAKWLSDYHGVIAHDDLVIDPIALVKGCRLKTFDFDHLPAVQRSFQRFSHGTSPSHTMDLRQGFVHYAAGVNVRSSLVRATWRRRRQLAREMGRVRFVQIAALLLSMRSLNVQHCWFSAYDVRFARWSPGIILLLELAKAASTHGIETVDLGMGTYPYKTRLATGRVDLLRGRIERPSAVAAWRMARRGVRSLARCWSSRRSGRP